MTNEIKILNSEKEAKGLEGNLYNMRATSRDILPKLNLEKIEGKGSIEDLYPSFLVNFTPIQRLESITKEISKELFYKENKMKIERTYKIKR